MLNGDLRDLFLPSDTADIGDQFTFNTSISVDVDLVDEPEEQIDERVGDLAPPSPTQRCDERHRDWLRRCEQIGPIRARCTRAPRDDGSLRRVTNRSVGMFNAQTMFN